MRALTLFCALCVFFYAAPASAKVAAISIEELLAGSDEIVVATVTELAAESPLRNQSVSASAVVKRTLKGSVTGTFRFLASPTWTCDSSTAVQGETVLLFLKRHRDHHFVIAHSGRGRMPLRVVSDKEYVTLWSDVWLPSGAPTIEGPDPKGFNIVSVELAYVEALIKTASAQYTSRGPEARVAAPIIPANAKDIVLKGGPVCLRRLPDESGRILLDCAIGLRGDDDQFYGCARLIRTGPLDILK